MKKKLKSRYYIMCCLIVVLGIYNFRTGYGPFTLYKICQNSLRSPIVSLLIKKKNHLQKCNSK